MNRIVFVISTGALSLALVACAPITPAPTGSSWPQPPPKTPDSAPQPKDAPSDSTIRSGDSQPQQQPSPAVASLLKQGWALYRQENYEAALGVAERAQRIDARSPEVYLLMASAHFSLYQLAVAEQVARKGLAMTQTGTAVGRQLQSLLAQISASR